MNKMSNFRLLIIIACLFGGLLAGNDVYRYLIEVPAWRNLDIVGWTRFSKHADLGNGLFIFPIEAFGGSVPLIIASVICLKNKHMQPMASSLYVSTVFAIAGLVLTLFAAPIMLNLPKTGSNISLMQQSFDRFHFWGSFRALAQLLSFFFCIVAFSKLHSVRIFQQDSQNLPKTVKYETK